MKFDWIVVGAGVTGATFAEQLATRKNARVLVVEKRDHIAGNSYDAYDENGILVQPYGPHIFHTDDKRVFAYLSRFTKWRPYQHRVRGIVDGCEIPLPFNLSSLYMVFSPNRASQLESLLLQGHRHGERVPISALRRSEHPELRALGDYVFEKIYRHYSTKQWGVDPETLSAAVTGRVPVVVSRDDRYFHDRYQAMPKDGFSRMVGNMLKHPKIKLLLQTDFSEVRDSFPGARIFFTGSKDDYFRGVHGPLPYRSLRFEAENHPVASYQSVAVINYPNEYDYTRVTEFKQLTGQTAATSTIVREYPEPYQPGSNEPYYPLSDDESLGLSKRYDDEASRVAGEVVFAGRLGDYKYYNMDQAVARSLFMADELARA